MQTNGLQFSDEQLNKALRDVFDLFEHLAGLNVLLLGETAKSVKEGHLTGNKITVGLKQAELTPERASTIVTYLREYLERGTSKTMVYEPDIEHLISYDFAGIPIEIRIITRNYSFFKNPDFISYQFDEYTLPNPIEKYLKAQYIVQ